MAQDTLLGFPAHTLPYRRGEFTTLLTVCVLLEHTRPRSKSGKVCRSDTRPGDVRERAERSEGSDTTPTSHVQKVLRTE